MVRTFSYFLLLISTAVFSQGIAFNELPPAEVFQLAQTQKKPVFYMFYATWCSHCNKMKKEVLVDSKVAEFYNENFVCAWQDMEKGDTKLLGKKYGAKSYPTFAVIDGNGELLYSFAGEFEAAAFIKEGQQALIETNQFPYLKKQFYSDLSNANKCYAYVAALRKSNLETNAEARLYLSKVPESVLVSDINWKIIANGIRDIRSREFQFVLKNQDEFAKVASAKRVERKILNVVTEVLQPFVQLSDTLNYNKQRVASAAIGLPKTDSLVYKFDRTILESTKNWTKLHQVNLASIQSMWKYPSEITSIVSVYEKNINDEKALKQAIVWQEQAAENKPSKENYLLLSKLNLKVRDRKKANYWAEKARDISIQYGWSTKEADEMIQQIKSL